MKLVSFLLRHARKSFAFALLAGIISGAANTALLAVINATLRDKSAPEVLMRCFIALCIILPAARFLSESLLTYFSQGALFRLRMRLSRQMLDTPLLRLEEVGSHRMMAVFTEDIPAITNALFLLPLLFINIALVVGGLIYMGWMSGILLLMVVGFIVAGVVMYRLPMMRALHHMTISREQAAALLDHFRALTQGAKELKLHSRRREAFFSEVFQSTASALCRSNSRGMIIYSAAASWGQVLVFVVIGLILFVLPSFKDIGPQALTGFTLTLLYLMTPMQFIVNAVPTINRANLSLGKIEEFGLSLSAPRAESAPLVPATPASSWKHLELRGVTHAYAHEREEKGFVLGPIDLHIHPGEVLFLVGGNGSGKTTFAKVLTGLYTPETGEIYLDGRPVSDETREAYRQHFSVVFSDFFLFDKLLGLDTPELDAEARAYLTELQLEHKVQVKNGALSTTSLSQGQRKRLALLTAYLEDRPIYVFDEWAADQDPLFRNIFYLKLLPELKAKGKTVVVISHDDRYFSLADRLIKLEYGKIVGPPNSTPIPEHIAPPPNEVALLA